MKNFRKSVRVAGFAPLDAALDVATSVVDKTTDVTSSVWDRVPGHEIIDGATRYVSGPLEDFVNGPMRDFAKTGVGEVFMRAVSVAVGLAAYTLTPAMGQYVFAWVGPTLAFAAWSIPGLAKGEPFDEALVKEFAYRVAYVVGIFSKEAGETVARQLGPMMSEQLTKALDEGKRIAKDNFPGVNTQEALRQLGVTPDSVLQGMGLTPKQLAAKLGIREDVAAMAIGWLRRDPKYQQKVKEWYDPRTGQDGEAAFYAEQKNKRDAANAEILTRLINVATTDPCFAYTEAVRLNQADAIAVFRKRCEQRKLEDTALVNLATKNPCLAYVEAVRLRRTNAADLLKKRCADLKKSGSIASSQSMMSSDDTFAKASGFKVALIVGAVLTAGGIAWFKLRRGK